MANSIVKWFGVKKNRLRVMAGFLALCVVAGITIPVAVHFTAPRLTVGFEVINHDVDIATPDLVGSPEVTVQGQRGFNSGDRVRRGRTIAISAEDVSETAHRGHNRIEFLGWHHRDRQGDLIRVANTLPEQLQITVSMFPSRLELIALYGFINHEVKVDFEFIGQNGEILDDDDVASMTTTQLRPTFEWFLHAAAGSRSTTSTAFQMGRHLRITVPNVPTAVQGAPDFIFDAFYEVETIIVANEPVTREVRMVENDGPRRFRFIMPSSEVRIIARYFIAIDHIIPSRYDPTCQKNPPCDMGEYECPNPSWFLAGSGTVVNPYILTTMQCLATMRYLVNSGAIDINVPFGVRHFRLGTNITLQNSPWIPIGTIENPFVGTFDGNGFTISSFYVTNETAIRDTFNGQIWRGGTFVDLEETEGENVIFAGLFGVVGQLRRLGAPMPPITQTAVRNLSVSHAVISIDVDNTHNIYAGIIAADMSGNGFKHLTDLSVGHSRINIAGGNEVFAGLVVGRTDTTTIRDIVAVESTAIAPQSINITGGHFIFAGGLFGRILRSNAGMAIADAVARVNVTATGRADRSTRVFVGGLSGYVELSVVRNSTSLGNVTATATGWHAHAGALVGAFNINSNFGIGPRPGVASNLFFESVSAYSMARATSVGAASRAYAGGLWGILVFEEDFRHDLTVGYFDIAENILTRGTIRRSTAATAINTGFLSERTTSYGDRRDLVRLFGSEAAVA